MSTQQSSEKRLVRVDYEINSSEMWSEEEIQETIKKNTPTSFSVKEVQLLNK